MYTTVLALVAQLGRVDEAGGATRGSPRWETSWIFALLRPSRKRQEQCVRQEQCADCYAVDRSPPAKDSPC